MERLLGQHWHEIPADEVVQLLGSHVENGLDLFDIQERQQRLGPNVLTPRQGKSPLARFLSQFRNPLIYILLGSTVVTAALKDWKDSGIIFLAVLVNVIIGFAQELKAERAIEALARFMTSEATVIRGGRQQRVSSAELVPGDLVTLKSGDKVPADMRLIRARSLQIAEAALTGESVPVEKAAESVLPASAALGDRRNMAYASTLVSAGQGVGVVTATGDGTEVGRISELISSTPTLETPLTRKMARFSGVVMYGILLLATATVLIGVLRGQPLIEVFTAAIALAVAMIPEGLPAALTVTLAIGVSRMARRRAIIRRLPAVEALGSVTVIASDKTGTLTQNQMTVQRIRTTSAEYHVTGTGYAPVGEIVAAAADDPALAETLRAGLLCNDSTLVNKDGAWEAAGDPTEVALLVAAHKGGAPVADHARPWPRLDAIPFESHHQYMATLHDAGEGQPRIAYVKGAVEVILERCTAALGPGGQIVPLDARLVHGAAESLAADGRRVLAFARAELPAGSSRLHAEDVESGLTFLGLQAMIDPPRPEAISAVRTAQEAGISVKMITGDHALTAVAIAQELGLEGERTADDRLAALSGKDLAECCDEALIEKVQGVAVFARVSPEQKLRLVKAFQARGHIVAMTGDGVNDGPALKQADVGVAMGIAGTDVAKEAADTVLTDDNFATIAAAVEEGRKVYDNLTKIIAWTLPTNVGEGLIILLAIVAGIALPILPIHILWINMVTVSVLGIVLALEPGEPDVMKRAPRSPAAPILSREILRRVILVAVIILIGAFGLFEWEMANGTAVSQARTVAVNAVIVIELFYLLNCRSLTRSVFAIGVFSNRWAWAGIAIMSALQLLFTYAPFMNQALASAPIGFASWGRVLAVGFVGYWVVELDKRLTARRAAGPRAGRRVAASNS